MNEFYGKDTVTDEDISVGDSIVCFDITLCTVTGQHALKAIHGDGMVDFKGKVTDEQRKLIADFIIKTLSK